MPTRCSDDDQQPGHGRPGDGSAALAHVGGTRSEPRSVASPPEHFAPPPTAIGAILQRRLERIYRCEVDYHLDINTRPTTSVLGGYYRSRRLVRIYTHDRVLGPRPLNELFDTFLHEVAHHLEYTEPHSFARGGCRRRPGLMHSRLFWRILGLLKHRWALVLADHHG